MTSHQIRLRDGRRLGYAEYGDPRGGPAFYFHGFPGSRLEAVLAESVAARCGVRIIAPDRPGIGLSDFRPGRALADWPDDVAELADALGLGRFAVVGASGGGPYAAACAWRIPRRLTAVGIVCGLAPLETPGATEGMLPMNRRGFLLARRFPLLAGFVYTLAARRVARRPERLVDRLAAALGEPDTTVLRRPDVRQALAGSIREAFRRGPRGQALELGLYAGPWRFALEDICAPVFLWHGERDVVVPPTMGRRLAAAIPGCRATFYPDEGHFSIIVDHLEEILRVLAA